MKIRKSLKNPRRKAFEVQSGLCFYCNHSMWNETPKEFSSKYLNHAGGLKLFQCTGEHLVPHSKGGSRKRENIVAACYFCNTQRHKRKRILNPTEFKAYVSKRIEKGKWNTKYLRTL